MKYGYTIFYVDDVKETIKFYETAFGFTRKFISQENDYGELITGETTIAFASFELGNSNVRKGFTKIENNDQPIGMEMAFITEQIEKDFQTALIGGAVEIEKIREKPWGQKVGYLKDNNGILIEICSPVKN